MIGGVTKERDFPFGIDHRIFGKGKNGARTAQADADHPRLDIPGADRRQHVIAAAGADQDFAAQIPFPPQSVAEQPGRTGRGTQSGQFGEEIFVDVVDQRPVPSAGPDIEQSGPGSVAVFHLALAGQPEIDVIMRQKHRSDLPEIVGLIFLEPQKFGRGVAGHHRVAGALDQFFDAAEGLA